MAQTLRSGESALFDEFISVPGIPCMICRNFLYTYEENPQNPIQKQPNRPWIQPAPHRFLPECWVHRCAQPARSHVNTFLPRIDPAEPKPTLAHSGIQHPRHIPLHLERGQDSAGNDCGNPVGKVGIMQILVDVLGWVGAILYLVGYALVSMKRVEGDSLLFQGINIMAGILLVINTFYWRSYPSVALNVAWIGIAVFTLRRKYSVPN